MILNSRNNLFVYKWPKVEEIKIMASLDMDYFPTPWKVDSWLEMENLDNYLLIHDVNFKSFALFYLSVAENLAHLLKILVHPDFRNDGNAVTMLKMAEESLRAVNFEKIYLEVEVSNLSAISLYKKYGFEEAGLLKNFYGAKRNAMSMLFSIRP